MIYMDMDHGPTIAYNIVLLKIITGGDKEVCPGYHKRFEKGEEKHWIRCDYCICWWHYSCAGFKRRPSAKLKCALI